MLRGDLLVLCYHAVSERWRDALAVTPAALERQVGFLLRRGYRAATFTQAVTAPPGPKTFAVTFDDAFASVGALGAPVLARLGVPATVFVPTALVGTGRPMLWPGIDHLAGGPHEDEIVGMRWDEIAGLEADGWEIGAHTRTHPHLTRLPQAELEAELTGARVDLDERLGGQHRSVAYPYGDVDERVMDAAARCGYEHGASLPGNRDPWPADRPLGHPRVMVFDDGPARFALEASRLLRLVRRSPVLPPLVAAGRVRGRLVRLRG